MKRLFAILTIFFTSISIFCFKSIELTQLHLDIISGVVSFLLGIECLFLSYLISIVTEHSIQIELLQQYRYEAEQQRQREVEHNPNTL
jgi:hypothetical protein